MIKFGDKVLVSIPNKQQVKGVVCGWMKHAVDEVALVALDGGYKPVYKSFLYTYGSDKQAAVRWFEIYNIEFPDEIVKEK